MVLTVFVMEIFWQRDMVRSFADYTERIISMLFQEEERVSVLLKTPDNTGLHSQILAEAGGALGAGTLRHGGDIQFLGSISGYENELQQILSQSYTSGKQSRILLGFSWNILVPAKKYLVVVRLLPKTASRDEAMATAFLYSLEPVYASMRNSQRMLLGYLLVNGIILIMIGLYRFRRFTVAPIEELVRLTDAYEEDGGVPFLGLGQGNELGQLSTALHQMLHRIEQDRERLQKSVLSLESVNTELIATREEMVRAEKLASVGRLAAGLAHEIGNPIGVVQGYLGLLQQDDLTSVERKDFARRSENELQRINRLIRQLLDFSRINGGQQEDVCIHAVVQAVVEMVSCQPSMDGVAVHCNLAAEHDLVRGTVDQLQQVFLNCLLNAADALAESKVKEVEIVTRLATQDDAPEQQDVITVSITDSGTGIEEEALANIFDPFFTTKEPGKGTGLGLSVAYSIVENCKGSMKVESIAGEGTTVNVELPLVARERVQ